MPNAQPPTLGRGSTFIHKRFKMRVTGITRKGVRCVRVNQPGLTFEVPFCQLPKKFQ